jgi:DNA-binding NarL/FixJ family response regulator
LIRVAVVAEVRLYRDGLADALAADARFEVVAAAPTDEGAFNCDARRFVTP